MGTYDPTQDYWTDTAVDNAGRSWTWIVYVAFRTICVAAHPNISLYRCNEVGFFQEGAPKGHPTLVTRLVQPPYDERQCVYMFEEAFGSLGHLPVPNVDATNKAYDGWFTKTQNLFFANGHRTCHFSGSVPRTAR